MEGRKPRTHYINFSVWEESFILLQDLRWHTHKSQVELFDEAVKDLAAKYRKKTPQMVPQGETEP
jgi:hypothetical protein